MQCVITFGVFKVCSCLTLSSDLLCHVCVCIFTLWSAVDPVGVCSGIYDNEHITP